jgi:hypothetical protein
MATKKFDHFLTLDEEIGNVGWIPSKQPPGLQMMIYSPQRLISLQKLSVTQELAPANYPEGYVDGFMYFTEERRILRKSELTNWTALVEDTVAVAKLEMHDHIQY